MTTAVEVLPLALAAAERRLLLAGSTGDPLQALAAVDRAADDLHQLQQRTQATASALLRSTGYGPGGCSWYADLLAAHQGDSGAQHRQRHARQVQAALQQLEARDIGSAALNGLVPPAAWPQGLVPAARTDSPVSDWLINAVPLPDVGMRLVVPRLTTAATASAQTAEAVQVTESDPASTPAVDTVATIAVRIDMSRQLLERATSATDLLVSVEIASALAAERERQVLAGSGASGDLTGLLAVSGTASITATGATDGDGAGLLSMLLKAGATYAGVSGRLPTLVMAPRRAQYLTYQLGSGGLAPSLVPAQPGDPAGTIMRLGALPIISSGAVPTSLGAGANEDRVILLGEQDAALYLSAPEVTVSAASVTTVTLQVSQYAALPVLRPGSVHIVSGTALARVL